MASNSAPEATNNRSSPTQKDGDIFLIRVAADLPSLQDCYSFVCDDSCGAVATFVGTTRNNFNDKTVKKLSYEGYIPMAEKELQKLCREARDRYPSICKIAAVHIVGDCPVGAASVILAASSPHRKASLACVDFLIDELKARIPIWKLEVYEGGGDDNDCIWKENIEWHEGKRRRIMVKQQNHQQSLEAQETVSTEKDSSA